MIPKRKVLKINNSPFLLVFKSGWCSTLVNQSEF